MNNRSTDITSMEVTIYKTSTESSFNINATESFYNSTDERAFHHLDSDPVQGHVVSDSLYTVVFFILTVSGVLGIIGNGFVIFLSRTDKTFQHPFGMLLEVLCWCGLLMSVLGTPFTAASNYARQWLFGQVGCDIYAFVMTWVGLMQQDVVIIIAIYRYSSLFWPYHMHKLTKTCILMALAVCFLDAMVWSVAPVIGWGKYTLEGIGTSCGPDWISSDANHRSYTAALVTCHLFIPMPILFIAYGRIIGMLYRLRQVRDADYLDMERKTLPMIIAIAIGFCLANIPYGILSMTTLIFGKGSLHPLVATIPAVLMKMSCFWNSIIYIATNSSYRNAVRRAFKNRIGVGNQT